MRLQATQSHTYLFFLLHHLGGLLVRSFVRVPDRDRGVAFVRGCLLKGDNHQLHRDNDRPRRSAARRRCQEREARP